MTVCQPPADRAPGSWRADASWLTWCRPHEDALRALVWAYLRSQLFPGDSAWTDAVRALNQMSEPVGAVRST